MSNRLTRLDSEMGRRNLNGSHILYNASYRPHYYGFADYIEKVEV